MTGSVLGTRAANLVFYLVLARWVGVEPFGMFVFALAFAGAAALIPDWGMNELAVREVARDRRLAAHILANGLALKGPLILLTLAGTAVILNALGYPRPVQVAVYLAGGYFLAQSVESLFFSMFRAFEQMRYEAILSTCRDLSLTVAGLLLLLSGAGIPEVLLAYALIGTASSLVSATVVCTRFVPLSCRLIDPGFALANLTRTALPFAVGNLLLIFYARHAILILQHFRGPAEVGWYGAADKLIDAATVIPHIALAGLYPAFSRLATTSRRELEEAVATACWGIAVIGLFLALATNALLAEPLVKFLYGSAFLPSVWVLRCLIWTLPFFFVARVILAFCASIGRQRQANGVLGLALLFGVTGNLLAATPFGMRGVAVVTLASGCLLCMMSLSVLAREIPLRRVTRVLPGLVAAGLASGLTTSILRSLGTPWVVNLIFTGVAYVVVLWTGRGLSEAERARWQGALVRFLHRAGAA
jgi:O-antigen/teichoic acid export membrane protein